MKRVKTGSGAEEALLREIAARSSQLDADVSKIVGDILEDVRLHGDEALRRYTEKFDHCKLTALEVTKEELRAAVDACDPSLVEALRRSAENICAFHNCQKQQTWKMQREDGILLGQRVRGLKRAGLYVPGGTAAYPSSVLMNAIPAKVAGVQELVMVTPPGQEGMNPAILAAAEIAGVDRVFRVGGAQAVAALAYGTESVPQVDKIVGPGNIFVATAKKLVFGKVDIDMIAGPSEVLILADETANPVYVAADLMSQAEHDVLASAILITTDPSLPDRVEAEIERQLQTLSRADIIRQSLRDFGAMIVARDEEEAVALANRIAPEHLEILFRDAERWIERIDNAGSVFVGEYSPEPLGDYYAGPNHVLPTSGTARFFSPLSVDSFTKKSSFIGYTQAGLRAAREDIVRIAQAEGLTAHANSIYVRFPDMKK